MAEFAEYNDKYFMPLRLGNELTAESFAPAVYSNTYMLAAPRYFQFYASFIRPRVLQYNGWVNGFHNSEYGVIPTYFLQKVAKGIENTVLAKPIVLNSENAETNHIVDGKFKKTHFDSIVHEAFSYAIAGGTSLLKLNKDGKGDLRFEAIPMTDFFISVDGYGDIDRVRSFIATYHDTISANVEYRLCEERFYRYAMIGTQRKRFPMVHYIVYQTTTNANYESVPDIEQSIPWQDIPYDIRKMLQNDYGDLKIDAYWSGELAQRSKSNPNAYDDCCTLLPFDDDLGCRLIKFTENIPSFPKFPFGQPIGDLLMNESYQYDQLKFFERCEVYISRARAMVDDSQTNPNDPDARKGALDPVVFTYYYNPQTGEKDGKPVAIQFELRSDKIRTEKQNILDDTAFALNLSSSTVAAWLSDGSTQKTATEVENEKTKTETFITEKTRLLKEPLQALVDMYFHYEGATAPDVNLIPEVQTSKSDTIRLYSELYGKGQCTPKMLAEKILGTCSYKELKEFEEFLEERKQTQATMPQLLPQASGEVESPNNSEVKEASVQNMEVNSNV